MWTSLSHIIIKFRILLIVLLAVITIFMAYKAKDTEMSFDFVKTVPDNDPDMIFFKNFKELFGEDGNLVAVGIKDSAIYQSLNFRRLKYLSEEFASLNGVNDVISLPLIQRLKKNTREKIFELEPVFSDIPEDQHQLDSLLTLAKDQKFYSGQIINEENGALLILVSINKEVLNSKKRIVLTKDIIEAGEKIFKSYRLAVALCRLAFCKICNSRPGKEGNEHVPYVISVSNRSDPAVFLQSLECCCFSYGNYWCGDHLGVGNYRAYGV